MQFSIFIVFAFNLVFLTFNARAEVQKTEQVDNQIKVPEDLKKMLAEFKQAIKSNNKSKASELSQFPLKNLAYGAKQRKNKKEFESSIKEISRTFCFDSVMPEKESKNDEWTLDCDGSVFYFGKINKKWKYLGYENINE